MKLFFLAIIPLISHIFISVHAQTTVPGVSFTYEDTDFALFQTSPDINQAGAQTQCINWGGNLATIKSGVVDSLLLYSSPDLDTIFTCHIGLNDIDSEAGTNGSTFVWIDGSNSSYRNWGTLLNDKPVAIDNYDCVRYRYRGGVLSQGWLNDPCTVERNCYFCSKPGTSNGCDLTYEGSCYKVFNVSTPINWLDAQSSCAIWGGDLTSIITKRENNYINTLITSSVGNGWTGLNDREVEGTYTWIDGTIVSYTNWTSSPSDDTNRNCVQIDNAGNGVWESVSCDTTLNAFLCKRDLSSTVTIDGRFGKLTDGRLDFEELVPDTFVFDSLTLACGGSIIYWGYSQYNTITLSVVSATFDDIELGLSWLDINVTKQGYYGCQILNEFYKEIGVFDPSLTTVAVPGNTYTYIIGIDRQDVQLLCDPLNGGYTLFHVNWTTEEYTYYNPINIYSKLEGYPSEPTKFSCKSRGNEILSIYISVQVPLVYLRYGARPTKSFSMIFPEMNEFIIPSTESDISLSSNIEGKWTLPDNIESTNSLLTIPNFSSHNDGVYKFYTINWDGVEVCAIQILLIIAVEITNFDDPLQQVNYTVDSPVSTLNYASTYFQDNDVLHWTTEMVSNGDIQLYDVEYSNPVNLTEVFSNVGAGLWKISCFYRLSPVTLLGSLQLAMKDSVTVSISYEGFNMSFSDANNPTFPSPQEIRILEGTKNVRFTCSLYNCLWSILHKSDTITADTYTIPELTSAFNGNIALKRVTSSGTVYTTAHISIYVIQQETGSINPITFILIIVLLLIFIVIIIMVVIIPVFIFLFMKRRKSPGGSRPKISKPGGEAFPGYENLTVTNSPEKDHNIYPDYSTIDETSLVTTDTQEKNKRKNMPAQSESCANIAQTQKGDYTRMKQGNFYGNSTVLIPAMEIYDNLSPKSIVTENFPVVYQRYVESGIGNNSLFSIEFQKLNENSKQVLKADHFDAIKVENVQKNPTKDILPFDENRVFLNSPNFDCDYINASYINDRQFIASIHPTKETHRDFLQMIFQTEASMVIMLTTRREKAKIISGISNRVCYWPKKDEPINCEPFVATLIKSIETNAFVKQDISLKETSSGKEHIFTQCISPIWNEDGTVAEMTLGVVLLSKIIKQKQGSSNVPVIIHCVNGISKTGIVLAVLNAIRDINLRKSVNIFATVRFLRVQRMNMIPTLACYTTCYSLLNEYCSIHL